MVAEAAAGDVRSGSTKQVGSASGEGIAALLSVRRWLEDRRLARSAVVDEDQAEPVATSPVPV
jgi:hypothetical protein